VATKICKIYRLICQGDYGQVNNIVSGLQKSAAVTSSQKQQAGSDEDDDDDDMVCVDSVLSVCVSLIQLRCKKLKTSVCNLMKYNR